MNENLKALISCFVRAYHNENDGGSIFNDPLAKDLLKAEEYESIRENLENYISFYKSDFLGNKDEELRQIVNSNLAPVVLGQSAFCERALDNAVLLGCRQCLIFASGYDTTAYLDKYSNMHCFEIDTSEIICDKQSRLEKIGVSNSNVSLISCDFAKSDFSEKLISSDYDADAMSFSSLFGINSNLTKEQFDNLISSLSKISSQGSEFVFDYLTPYEDKALAQNGKYVDILEERIKSKYTYNEIERLLSKHGYLIYEHLNSDEIGRQFFDKYNKDSPYPMKSPRNAALCLAVKKEHIALT